MQHVLSIVDKSGRLIHLSPERWQHITQEHPDIIHTQPLIDVLIQPLIIRTSHYDENVRWYYREHEERKQYLLVAVKYLNEHGFVITAYFVRNIK